MAIAFKSPLLDKTGAISKQRIAEAEADAKRAGERQQALKEKAGQAARATAHIDAVLEEQEKLQREKADSLLPEPLVAEHDAAWVKRSQASKGWRAAKKAWQQAQGLPDAAAIRAENQRKWAEQRAARAERNRLESERRKVTLQQRLEAIEKSRARRDSKALVRLMVDRQVLAWFKAGGKGWSVKMAKMLEDAARKQMAGENHETTGQETEEAKDFQKNQG